MEYSSLEEYNLIKIIDAFNPEMIDHLTKKAIDFHCHGVGRFDFTEILDLNLQEIENIFAERKQRTILTLYLPKPSFDDFIDLMDQFHRGKQAGKYAHLDGFALEGPLLASHGGTPEKGVWMPTQLNWEQLADCGEKGLIYVILSPDAHLPGSYFKQVANDPDIKWIAETLLKGGVLPAPGHFIKSDPKRSAQLLQAIFDSVEVWGHGPTITDHLFNDMPRNFKHAWRTPEQRAKRDEELSAINLSSWNLDNLEEKLGIIPAVMIKNARKGLVKICQNFDGEHVDLAIVKKSVELIGAENMLMMTDSIESKRLAGRHLHMLRESTLLYQDEGIVAAGSQNIRQQISNMIRIGLSLEQIEQITHIVPSFVFKKRNSYIKGRTHAQVDCV
jgi:N-acetylglucosamine-6-phosphate deacetylase